jgi:hypothetical protein
VTDDQRRFSSCNASPPRSELALILAKVDLREMILRASMHGLTCFEVDSVAVMRTHVETTVRNSRRNADLLPNWWT